MNRAQLIQDLKNMIGPSSEVDNAGLATWLNDAYLYLVDEIGKANPDYFTKSATASTLSGQQEYELPDDFEKILMVNLQIEGTWRRVLPLPAINSVPALAGGSSEFSWGDPRYYLIGDVIGFVPVPAETTSNNIKLWYVYTPTELTTDSAEPAVPTKYHHLLKYGAYASYLDQDDEHVAAERMRQRFEKRVAEAVENLSERQVEEPRSVLVSSSEGLYSDDDAFL